MDQTLTLVSSYIKTCKNKQQAAKLVDTQNPSDTIIQNILNYSKSLTVKKSNYVDFIEVIAS